MPSDEWLEEQAQECKTKGNALFSQGDAKEAIALYTQGLVLCDRAVDVSVIRHVKTTLLSNRAMCYLKNLETLEACMEDCTAGLSLDPSDASLRNKLLFRRAKARFLVCNLPTAKDQNASLQECAKDLLQVLQTDPKNKDANQLLTTVRAQYKSQPTIKATPLSKALQALKDDNDDVDQALHQLRIIMGLLDNDVKNTAMELGRCQGVDLLLETALKSPVNDDDKDKKDEKNHKRTMLALQSLAQAATHPEFCRTYLVHKQTAMIRLAESCPSDAMVLVMALFVRIILHTDRDDPNADITGKTSLDYAAIVSVVTKALERFVIHNKDRDDPTETHKATVIRAVLDLINTWTAGTERDATIRHSLDLGSMTDPTMPIPKTQAEIRAFTPQELAAHRKRQSDQRNRDGAWAFERCIRLLSHLNTILKATCSVYDHVVRREMIVTVSRLLALLDDDDRIKTVVKPYLQMKDESSSEGGVVIEEISEEEEEKMVETVQEERIVVSLEQMMQRAILTCALLLSRKEEGAWALGVGWKASSDELKLLVQSHDVRAMCLASEVVSAAATVEPCRHLVANLMNGGVMTQLLQSKDRDIRSGAASAVAKLGLSNKETQQDEGQVMGMLQAACELLEDDDKTKDGSFPSSPAAAKNVKKEDAKFRHFSSFATSSVERAVEMISYMISSTVVKEELAAGFQPTAHSTKTALQRLVQTADIPNAGESLTGFALATIFQNMAATNLQIRKEGFEGKEVTMEQYDEMQKLGKTEEEKEVMDSQQDPDTNELCLDRVKKMAAAHVPRAMVTLTEGASDHTLEQIFLGFNRMANEISVRGLMIQQGVMSACIKVDKNESPTETDTMKKVITMARHCIAKMLVTTNPTLLTSAQRLGAIRPLIQLVRDNKSSDLAQFEALLSLTNIGGSGEDAQNRIVNERGLAAMHFAMFSDHELVRRAATEAMSNMIPHKAMMEHLSHDDNIRLWMAFATDYEDHYECARAAAGCLAMATQELDIAEKLVVHEKFRMQVETMLESGRLEIMHRIFVLVHNMMSHGGKPKQKTMAEGLVLFCQAYVANYYQNNTESLDFPEHERALLPVTVDLAKEIIKLADEDEP